MYGTAEELLLDLKKWQNFPLSHRRLSFDPKEPYTKIPIVYRNMDGVPFMNKADTFCLVPNIVYSDLFDSLESYQLFNSMLAIVLKSDEEKIIGICEFFKYDKNWLSKLRDEFLQLHQKFLGQESSTIREDWNFENALEMFKTLLPVWKEQEYCEFEKDLKNFFDSKSGNFNDVSVAIRSIVDCWKSYILLNPDKILPYDKEKSIFFVTLEERYKRIEESVEFWNIFENVQTKHVRNVEEDGFTVQNLKDELEYLGLTELFPEIQNYAEAVYSEVFEAKNEKVLRTCDLFKAIEKCLLNCIFKRFLCFCISPNDNRFENTNWKEHHYKKTLSTYLESDPENKVEVLPGEKVLHSNYSINERDENESKRVFTEEVLDLIPVALRQQNTPISENDDRLAKYRYNWETNDKDLEATISLTEFWYILEEFDVDKTRITIIPDPVYELTIPKMIEDLRMHTLNVISPRGELVMRIEQAVFHIFEVVYCSVNWTRDFCKTHENCLKKLKDRIICSMRTYTEMEEGTYVSVEHVESVINQLKNHCSFQLQSNTQSPLVELQHMKIYFVRKPNNPLEKKSNVTFAEEETAKKTKMEESERSKKASKITVGKVTDLKTEKDSEANKKEVTIQKPSMPEEDLEVKKLTSEDAQKTSTFEKASKVEIPYPDGNQKTSVPQKAPEMEPPTSDDVQRTSPIEKSFPVRDKSIKVLYKVSPNQ
ncbi:hypothetical protein B9Z55_009211 [Caenorhabditis nigoni]|uniref:DUF7809 domain-containing protein n=1 Tax=Caenorhabditis nigoni TaxID=1611254 RepID=A0A2G5UR53_9PELO|nr:hypothetical protein B9Z55_009211 [Caenorhabditis nigoni]